MNNYFILLGLSFDPIEADEEKIEEAINKKMQQWQNESKNPRKAIIAKENMALIPEIKKVMLDPKLREQEARKALSEQEKILKDVYYDVLIKSTKGTITTEELNEIHKKYKDYNITLEQIKEKVEVPIDENIDTNNNENSNNMEVINEDTRSQLETYFHNLLIDDMSIYGFIGGKQSDSNETLRNLSEKKLQFLLQKGDKSTQDEVEQKISGIAKNIFSSNEERKKYDNYLSGSRYFKLNELIRDGINSNNNTINANLYNIIVNIAEKEYKLSKKDAISYVNNFAKIYKIKLDENIIPDIILHQVKDNTVINNDEEPNKFEQESKSEIDKINEEKPTDNFEEIDKDEQEDEFADFDENVPPPIPQPVPRPIPKPQNQPENTDKIKPTIDFNSIIKTLEFRLNFLNSNNEKYIKEIEFYDKEYNKAMRIPNKILIIIYIISLSLFLIANAAISISYFASSDDSIKLFITSTTVACILEILYSLLLLKKTNEYYKYKNLTYIAKAKFDKLVNDNFVNSSVSLIDIRNNPDKVLTFFENLKIEAENLHNLTFNMKMKCLNAISSFNKAPKKGYFLGFRILVTLVLLFGGYYIILKYFPNLLYIK